MALERVQGMDVKYLGLSWILEILNLILDEKILLYKLLNNGQCLI